MTSAQTFVEAVDVLECVATGKEKFQLMHSNGRAKAKLLQKLFSQYAISWDSDWFPDLPQTPSGGKP